MILPAIGIGLLIALGFWIFGGFAQRLGGALLILVGAVGLATTGNVNAILLVTLGVAAWWTGHLHYALRHRDWKSVLAGHVFDDLAKAWRRIGRREGSPALGAHLKDATRQSRGS